VEVLPLKHEESRSNCGSLVIAEMKLGGVNVLNGEGG